MTDAPLSLLKVEPAPAGGFFEVTYSTKRDEARVAVRTCAGAPRGGHVATFLDGGWPKHVHLPIDDPEGAGAAAEALLRALADPDLGRRLYLARDLRSRYWSLAGACGGRAPLLP